MMNKSIADGYKIEYLDSKLLDDIDYQLFIVTGDNVSHPFRVRSIDFDTGEVLPIVKSFVSLKLAEEYFYSLSTMGSYSCQLNKFKG